MRESVSATYWDGMGTRPEGDAMGGASVEFGGVQTELQREHGPVASLVCCLALLLVGHQQLGQTKARQRLWTETLNRSCSCTISSDAHLTFVKDVPVSPRGNRALCNNKKANPGISADVWAEKKTVPFPSVLGPILALFALAIGVPCPTCRRGSRNTTGARFETTFFIVETEAFTGGWLSESLRGMGGYRNKRW